MASPRCSSHVKSNTDRLTSERLILSQRKHHHSAGATVTIFGISVPAVSTVRGRIRTALLLGRPTSHTWNAADVALDSFSSPDRLPPKMPLQDLTPCPPLLRQKRSHLHPLLQAHFLLLSRSFPLCLFLFLALAGSELGLYGLIASLARQNECVSYMYRGYES